MEQKEKQSAYHHIMKYTSLFGGIQMLNMMVGIVRNKLVAMILGPGGMGLLSLFNSTIKLVSDSTNLGIATSGVKTIAQDYDENNIKATYHSVDMIRMWSFLTGLFGFVVCALFGSFFSSFTFTWGNHSLHFILLSPIVAMTAITSGEMAILKGAQRLHDIMMLSTAYAIAVTLISIPIYYTFGESGIVPSLCIAALVYMLLTIRYSHKLFPYRLKICRQLIVEGSDMVRLGVAFVLAGILGSGADFLIKAILNNYGGLDVVGLYNAGYVMTFMYAGIVFSAMESDYFPRLSAIGKETAALNKCVNQQIEVTLLLVAPMLIGFLVVMPILLPMLYSKGFTPVVSMVQVSILAMVVRALALPVEYIPLANGNSKLYLAVEAIYDILMVALTFVGYQALGLYGTGLALTVAMIADYIVACIIMNKHYGYKMSAEVAKYASIQLPLAVVAYLSSLISTTWISWSIGILTTIISAAISIIILHKKTSLWQKLINKIRRK